MHPTQIPASHVVLLVVTLLAAVTDVRRGIIPNRLTLAALAAGLVLQSLAAGWGGLSAALLGAAICAVVPLLVFTLGGMGGGDLKLLAAIGALVGVTSGLEVQLLAYVLAGLYAGAVLAYRGKLLSTLAASMALLLPRAIRPRPADADDALYQELRMGLPIALAAAAVVLSAQAGWS